MKYYIDKNGDIYTGDLQPGDREATAEEVFALETKAIQDDFNQRIQSRLDNFARTRGYDGIMSAASYAGLKPSEKDDEKTKALVKKMATEGDYAQTVRATTWAIGIRLQDEAIASGKIPTWEEIEAQLPELVWPEVQDEGE